MWQYKNLCQGLIICLILFPFYECNAQSNKLKEVQQYVVNNWNNSNGMPQNTVLDLVQDENEFLWIATEEGVARFDGFNFRQYNNSNVRDLQYNYINDLEASVSGGIWAAGISDVLKIVDNRAQIIHVASHSLSEVTNIAEDDDGKLWGSTSSGQLFTITEDSVTVISADFSSSFSTVNSIDVYGEQLLIGTNSGLFSLDTSRDTLNVVPQFREINVRKVLSTSDTEYWIGTVNNGIYQVKNGQVINYTTEHGLGENFITDIHLNDRGEVWATTVSTGLFYMQNNTFHAYRHANLSEQDLRTLHFSDEGIIWVGSTGSGLFQLKPAEILSLPDSLILSSEIILPIYEHENGDIWIGTAGNGLDRIRNNELINYNTGNGLSHDIVLSIYGTEEYIFIGTASGLTRFNIEQEKFDFIFTVEEGLKSNIVQAVYESSDKTIWVATRNGGLHRVYGNSIHPVSLPDSLGHVEFISVFEDSKGKMWFTTRSTGIVKLSQEQTIEHISEIDGLLSNVTNTIYEDAEGDIWASSAKGISVIQQDTIRNFNSYNNLIPGEIYAFINDGRNSIWLSSNNGLQRLPEKELIEAKYSTDSSYSFSFSIFDRTSGMPNSEANGAVFPTAWQMKNGQLWFPTVNGVAIVDPEIIKSSSKRPNIYIESFRYENIESASEDSITVPAGVHFFETDFTSVDFINPHRINFYYRFIGLQNDWQQVNRNRTINLTIQNPGTYTIELLAEKDGVSSAVASKTITILPYFYQTIWFQIGVLVMLFSLGYLLHKLYSRASMSTELEKRVNDKTARLRQALGEREVLLQEVHHRVKNNLAVISGLLQIQQFMQEDPHVNKILNHSVTRIKSMALVHENLYKSGSFSHIDFRSFLEDLVLTIEKNTAASKKITAVKVHCDNLNLNVNQAVPCALIINEIMTAAIEHAFTEADKGNFAIIVKEDESKIKIIIRDNGKGTDNYLQLLPTMGMTVISTLIQQLGAESYSDTSDNTIFSFSFSKQELKGSHSRL